MRRARRGVVYLKREWNEELHPRDDDGKFSGDGGGGSSASDGGPETGGGGGTPEQRNAGVRQRLPEKVAVSEIPRWEGEMTPEMRAIETRFAEELAADPRGAWDRYTSLKDAGGGKIIATDVARELSPDYVADKSMSAAVHEPSSWFAKEMYKAQLEQPPGEKEEASVVFMAGGTGAGKTTALRTADPGKLDRSQIVYDSNFGGFSSSDAKIAQARAAGKSVQIDYVYRDPLEAFTAGIFEDDSSGQRGVLTRAMASGRTVPIDEHIKTHLQSQQTVPALANKWADDPGVTVRYFDNSRGLGKTTRVGSADALPKQWDSNTLRSELHGALERAYREGRISETVYRGTKGTKG